MAAERYKLQIEDIVILMVIEGDPKISVFKEPMIKWMRELIKLTSKETK